MFDKEHQKSHKHQTSKTRNIEIFKTDREQEDTCSHQWRRYCRPCFDTHKNAVSWWNWTDQLTSWFIPCCHLSVHRQAETRYLDIRGSQTAIKANQCCAAGAHRRYFRQCKKKYFRLSNCLRWFMASRRPAVNLLKQWFNLKYFFFHCLKYIPVNPSFFNRKGRLGFRLG